MDAQNIILAVILAAVLIVGGIYVNGFQNWLVWAVSEAEAMFGSNTGKLKLRYAYNLAIQNFPRLAKLIPFSVFSWMVDQALKVMREMIEKNKSIAEAITDKANEQANTAE